MSITGIEHSATSIGKEFWKVKKKKIMDGISMKYQPKKTFEKGEKEAKKEAYPEPQRKDFKSKAKYKVAYRKWLEKIS